MLRPHWFFIILWLVLTSFYLWGVPSLPLHPDESTQLYMSADFDQLWRNPISLAWQPQLAMDTRQRYRLLDAPMTRYLLGVGRSLASQPALPSDWDWMRSWQENDQLGALPSQNLLISGRLAIALLFPFSMLFIFMTGKAVSGPWSGILAAILLGTNTLVLLHTRRAMAEGPLLFGITAFMATLIHADRKPWLVGLAAAIAINAKQSTFALLLVGLLAVVWPSPDTEPKPRRMAVNSIQFLLAFVLLTLILNPVLWKQPLSASIAMFQARRALLSAQVADAQQFIPWTVLHTPTERLAALVSHLYLTPPAFFEWNIYHPQTAEVESTYLSTPGNMLWRGSIGGGLQMGLTLLGLVCAFLYARAAGPVQRRMVFLLLLATFFQTAALLLAVPLSWQRYYLPLVPLISIWASLGLVFLPTEMAKRGRLTNKKEHG